MVASPTHSLNADTQMPVLPGYKLSACIQRASVCVYQCVCARYSLFTLAGKSTGSHKASRRGGVGQKGKADEVVSEQRGSIFVPLTADNWLLLDYFLCFLFLSVYCTTGRLSPARCHEVRFTSAAFKGGVSSCRPVHICLIQHISALCPGAVHPACTT